MAKQFDEQSKIGAGHAEAMFRQGLRELRGALYADSNVAQQPEYGLYGTRTPGEVAESRRGDGKELDEEPPHGALAERLNEAERSAGDRSKESRELDRE